LSRHTVGRPGGGEESGAPIAAGAVIKRRILVAPVQSFPTDIEAFLDPRMGCTKGEGRYEEGSGGVMVRQQSGGDSKTASQPVAEMIAQLAQSASTSWRYRGDTFWR